MDSESENSVVDLVSSADEEAVDRKGRLKMMVQCRVQWRIDESDGEIEWTR